MITMCGICEKEFKIRPAKVKNVNYCSHACYWQSKKSCIVRQCTTCEDWIEVKPSLYREVNFCSIKCRSQHFSGESHQNWVEVKKQCLICNKDVPHHRARRPNGKYCSVECKTKSISGDKSFFWKDGSSFKIYPQEFSKSLKNRIIKRDGMACRNCKIEKGNGKKLHIHHIDKNTKNNSTDNLITLCSTCHAAEHMVKPLKQKEKFWPQNH